MISGCMLIGGICFSADNHKESVITYVEENPFYLSAQKFLVKKQAAHKKTPILSSLIEDDKDDKEVTTKNARSERTKKYRECALQGHKLRTVTFISPAHRDTTERIEESPQEKLTALHELRRCTPLHRACNHGDPTVVKALLERCPFTNDAPTVDITDVFGRTSLHCAVLDNNQSVIEELLKGGANINAQIPHARKMSDPMHSDTLKTPLHFAVQLGYPHLVECLLKAGANQWVKDASHQTPRSFIEKIMTQMYGSDNNREAYKKCHELLLLHETRLLKALNL